ncbi:hypothetical protein KJ865_06900, partial [Myxococcota bacterium]|nr:hypothetical protein [Myxococcota bacterium]
MRQNRLKKVIMFMAIFSLMALVVSCDDSSGSGTGSTVEMVSATVEQCPHGGVVITVDEVEQIICNGAPGEDAAAPLVTATPFEGAMGDCTDGGVLIVACTDDGTGLCVEGTETTTYVCHGETGETGENGEDAAAPLVTTSSFSGVLGGCNNGGISIVVCTDDGSGACEAGTE